MTERPRDMHRAAGIDAWLNELERRVPPTTPPSTPPDEHETAARQVFAGADLVARFAEAAQAVGVRVTPANADDWPEVAAQRARRLGGRRVGLCIHTKAWPARVLETLRRRLEQVAGVLLPDPPADAWAGVDLAVTDVPAAVAETGSLVWDSGPQRPRVATLLPPMLLAVVRAGQIVPDLLDLWPADGDALPAQRVLLTGPSKTADIEGVLVTGVHGPGVVEVVVVRDEPD